MLNQAADRCPGETWWHLGKYRASTLELLCLKLVAGNDQLVVTLELVNGPR